MQIAVDTESITSQYDVSEDQMGQLMDGVVKDITASYAERLGRIAGENLHSTRSRYQQSIKVFDEGRYTGVVLIDYSKDKLIKMLEEGASAFDMKTFFEQSQKAHKKPDGGWYLTIPFSQGTPDTIGDSSPFTSIMPKEVYDEVKEKPADIPTDTGFRSKGLDVKDIPEKYQIPQTRAAVSSIVTSKTFEEYKNKTSIYAGIVKIQDNVTGQNSYMSFRRVSDKSDASAFIFSGITAYNFADQAMSELNSHLQEELGTATGRMLKELGIT